MLTSDISLTKDPAGQYQPIVAQFARDAAAFDHAFKHAWYKLMTRDMGPVTRTPGQQAPTARPRVALIVMRDTSAIASVIISAIMVGTR